MRCSPLEVYRLTSKHGSNSAIAMALHLTCSSLRRSRSRITNRLVFFALVHNTIPNSKPFQSRRHILIIRMLSPIMSAPVSQTTKILRDPFQEIAEHMRGMKFVHEIGPRSAVKLQPLLKARVTRKVNFRKLRLAMLPWKEGAEITNPHTAFHPPLDLYHLAVGPTRS